MKKQPFYLSIYPEIIGMDNDHVLFIYDSINLFLKSLNNSLL